MEPSLEEGKRGYSEATRLLRPINGGSSFVEDMNPMELAIHLALHSFGVYLGLSVLGIISVSIACLTPIKLVFGTWNDVLNNLWAVFSPFWIAAVYGFVSHVVVLSKMCKIRNVTAEEKRNLARLASREAKTVVSLDMFPLVRSMSLVITTASLPVLCLVVVAQVLICLWLQGTLSSALVALTPLLLLEAGALVHSVLIRWGSVRHRVCGWLLVLLSTVTLGLRASDMWPLQLGSALRPLWVAMLPLWFLQAYLLALVGHVVSKGSCSRRRYRLTWRVKSCLFLYFTSLLLFLLAELLLVWGSVRASPFERTIAASTNSSVYFWRRVVTVVLLSLGSALGALAMYLVAEGELDAVLASQGYSEPLPLSRTARGWEPTGARTTRWLLLGQVHEAARVEPYRSQGRRRSVKDSPARGLGIHQELQRANSGSYANIEEEL